MYNKLFNEGYMDAYDEAEDIFLEGYYDALEEYGYLNEARKNNIGKRRNNFITIRDKNNNKRKIHVKPTNRKALTAAIATPARRATKNEIITNNAEKVSYKVKPGDIILKDKKGNSYTASDKVVDKNYQGGSKRIPNDGNEVIINKNIQKKKAYMFPNFAKKLVTSWGDAELTKNHVGVSHGDKNGNNDVSPVLRGAGNYKYLPKRASRNK